MSLPTFAVRAPAPASALGDLNLDFDASVDFALGFDLGDKVAFGGGLSAALTAFAPILIATRVIAFKLRLNARRLTKLKARLTTASSTNCSMILPALRRLLVGRLHIQAPVGRLEQLVLIHIGI